MLLLFVPFCVDCLCACLDCVVCLLGLYIRCASFCLFVCYVVCLCVCVFACLFVCFGLVRAVLLCWFALRVCFDLLCYAMCVFVVLCCLFVCLFGLL